MGQTSINNPPGRVMDLVGVKNVTCRTSFEILPVNFEHRDNPFQAFIFLCRYKGTIDTEDYEFRKCYARGCPDNLCPHVSQAVMVANRYLQKDYRKPARSCARNRASSATACSNVSLRIGLPPSIVSPPTAALSKKMTPS